MADSKFTSSGIEMIHLAQKAAETLASERIGSEHLLLALSQLEHSFVQQILRANGMTQFTIKASIFQRVGVSRYARYYGQEMSVHCKRIFLLSASESKKQGCALVSAEHILMALLQVQDSTAYRIVTAHGANAQQLYRLVATHAGKDTAYVRPSRVGFGEKSAIETKLLDQCSRDLTRLAMGGDLDPIIGRVAQLHRVIQTLSRRTKNNPALIGEPGVGKTAIVEGLALAIANGTAPSHLLGKRICSLDLPSMVAGTKYRGEFEDKLRQILNEVKKAGNIILFIDELHTIVGTGSAEGAIDAANILKPALSRGEFQIIGATTITEYRKYIEKDTALERRFQPITVSEPSREETLEILRGIKCHYEMHHHLSISEEALIAATDLSHRYLPHRFWPDKAIDLLDEAAAQTRLAPTLLCPESVALSQRADLAARQANKAVACGNFEAASVYRSAEKSFRNQYLQEKQEKTAQAGDMTNLTALQIQTVLSQWTGIPITDPTNQDKNNLLALEENLRTALLGQERAITEVSQAIRRGRLGLKDPNRPVGSFLLLGPSGVGKTQLCRTLAKTVFGTEGALIRFDMSEYMESHAVSRLIGAPPGYVGHEDGGQLTERVRRNPWSVVLLDEIEKAHHDIWSLLLQVMEEGVLTDSQGRSTDFRNCILIMTSNLGAQHFMKGQNLGFASDQAATREHIEQEVLSVAKKTFSPEFLNRLDNLLVFHPLDEETLVSIVRQLLQETQKRLHVHGLSLQVEEEAVRMIARSAGDKKYGARPLKRAIATFVETPAAQMLLDGRAEKGATLNLCAENDAVTVKLV